MTGKKNQYRNNVSFKTLFLPLTISCRTVLFTIRLFVKQSSFDISNKSKLTNFWSAGLTLLVNISKQKLTFRRKKFSVLISFLHILYNIFEFHFKIISTETAHIDNLLRHWTLLLRSSVHFYKRLLSYITKMFLLVLHVQYSTVILQYPISVLRFQFYQVGVNFEKVRHFGCMYSI